MAIAPSWDHSAPPLPRFALPGWPRALPTYPPGRHRAGDRGWLANLVLALAPRRRHAARHAVGYVAPYAARHRA